MWALACVRACVFVRVLFVCYLRAVSSRCALWMGVYGCVWVCMGVYGCVWVCMGVYGCVWVCMGVYGVYVRRRDAGGERE